MNKLWRQKQINPEANYLLRQTDGNEKTKENP